MLWNRHINQREMMKPGAKYQEVGRFYWKPYRNMAVCKTNLIRFLISNQESCSRFPWSSIESMDFLLCHVCHCMPAWRQNQYSEAQSHRKAVLMQKISHDSVSIIFGLLSKRRWMWCYDEKIYNCMDIAAAHIWHKDCSLRIPAMYEINILGWIQKLNVKWACAWKEIHKCMNIYICGALDQIFFPFRLILHPFFHHIWHTSPENRP